MASGVASSGCDGICRGIAFVYTGSSHCGALNPIHAPHTTSGPSRQSHISSSSSIVPKGTADDEPAAQSTVSSSRKSAKKAPGKAHAAATISVYGWRPCIWRYTHAAA